MAQMFRIGEVAKTTGLNAAAIRFYEAEGILSAPQRLESGYRQYSGEDVDLIRFVSRLRALEFPLKDVREIVALRRGNKAPCNEVRAAIHRELSAIQSRIADLERLRADLTELREEARGLPDDWPTDCVCNVLEGSQSRMSPSSTSIRGPIGERRTRGSAMSPTPTTSTST